MISVSFRPACKYLNIVLCTYLKPKCKWSSLSFFTCDFTSNEKIVYTISIKRKEVKHMQKNKVTNKLTMVYNNY